MLRDSPYGDRKQGHQRPGCAPVVERQPDAPKTPTFLGWTDLLTEFSKISDLEEPVLIQVSLDPDARDLLLAEEVGPARDLGNGN